MKKIISSMVALFLLVNCFSFLPTYNTSAAAENIAYMRTVEATSEISSANSATKAVDADGNTYWESQNYDQQNFIVDMWSPQTVSSVKIAWNSHYASQYQVQISTDKQSWTTVYENYSANGGTVIHSFTPVSARYVKIYCIRRATEYGFAINEFEIYSENIAGGTNTAKSNIRGKNFFFLGSSVTYGYASNGVSFVDHIADRNDCKCVKEAVSGTTLVDNGSSSYVQRMLNNLDKSADCDHFVCQLSTNDASQNLPLGTVSTSTNLNDFNKSTIIGAMEYIICYAKQTWNCPITFFTNTYYDSSNYQAMVNALYALQDKWGIGIIDLWNNEEMRNVSSSDYARYMSDNIHPTATGYSEWWTPVFEEYFQNYDYSGYISDAAKAKQEVLDYLYSMQGKQTIIGMHNREPNSEPAKQTNAVYNLTGKYPALWSGDFLFSASDVANRWTMIYECKNQWDNGAIVHLMLHVVPPTQNEPGVWDGGVCSELSDAQWNSLITDGGELNIKWKERLDVYAEYLQYLEDNGVPVMFRPFHEMNQSMFWWAGRTGTNGTGALFRLTRDYLENDKGLDNLIWVWDMQDLSYDWSAYNPGNDYWDIFAVDIYNSDYFTPYKYNQALSVAGDKLIAIGECDHIPTPEEIASQPRWSFVMSWAELTFSHNSNQEIQNLYNSNNTVTKDELPNLKVPAIKAGESDPYVSTVVPQSSTINGGDTVTFSATVRNMGQNLSGTLTVTFYIDNKLLQTVTLSDGIEPGGFKIVKTSRRPKRS